MFTWTKFILFLTFSQHKVKKICRALRVSSSATPVALNWPLKFLLSSLNLHQISIKPKSKSKKVSRLSQIRYAVDLFIVLLATKLKLHACLNSSNSSVLMRARRFGAGKLAMQRKNKNDINISDFKALALITFHLFC